MNEPIVPNNTTPQAPVVPVGAPPADLAVDTLGAAVSVSQHNSDLAAQAVTLNAVPVEAEVEDVSAAALPSAAYGDFVRKVGLAVADAQKSLDENSVAAAIKLAETKVPALIAMNQVINEDGELEKVEPVIQQDASLIQYIQPTFYQFSRVTMFARFDVSKFEADGTTKVASSSNRTSVGGGVSANGGFFGALFGGASADFRASNVSANASTQVDTESESARSSGSSYMLAVLEPRKDTRFPRPLIATQGPKLLLATAANSIPPGDQNNPATPINITITLFKKGGFSNTNNKTVDIVLSGPGALSSGSITLAPVNNDPQRLQGTVTLTRRASDRPGTANLRATLGGLTASASVDFPAPLPA